MASEGNETPKEDPKEGKRLFKFVFNVNKKCADETEMTQEFMADVKHFHEFDEGVTKCVQYMENIYIPYASRSSKSGEDSYSCLHSALADFKNHVPSNYTGAIEAFSAKMKKASDSRKTYQNIQDHQLRNMKRFHSEQFEQFLYQKRKFDESRKKMDQAKADVRDAKTTTAIEKKAICYQLAVDDFDQQTEELIKIIDALPAVKAGYCKDILMVLAKHKTYHADMSKFFFP